MFFDVQNVADCQITIDIKQIAHTLLLEPQWHCPVLNEG
jgi:hypothetical protein